MDTFSHLSIWIGIGVVLLLAIVLFTVPFLRRSLITSWILKAIQSLKLLPTISNTEQAAIEAGTVWVEGEFFSGHPNFQRLNHESYPQVTPEIQAFLDGPVEQVCQMASDWDIYSHQDLPPELWQYLKQERFLGMMIPKEYGGLGFSYLAFSAVMTKLASRSFTHTATVGVTNSLGPAKLLLHYGTPAQKAEYLPRLARGEDIPCFALTEPQAGSDAASITSEGVVFEGESGKLYLRLNWKKRYITLGAIATLIGLAFRLKDPDHLLGKETDLGITCALIAANTPGVVLGQRHDPMGVPFYNSPTEGHDVVIAADQIIGGVEQAGQGWKMLMQSLAAGRGISFPATCTGVAKLVTRVTGNYARVRRQFGLPIGRFEGIEEPLARIGGLTYLMDAIRLYTCGAVDAGEQPAVVSAIAKYMTTELSRQIVNDGMDILGGAGICRGPRNLLANIYTAIPITITVEGANILTRSMIIFGQGVIRSHPYVYQETKAIHQSDLVAFDAVFWKHVYSILINGFRAVGLNLSRGYFARSPIQGATARYYRKLAWASATFALMTDLSILGLGSRLKRQENLTGRFADILSWLYLGTATLRRYEAEGRQSADLPFVHWVMQYALSQIQQAFSGIFQNLPIPVLGAIFRLPVSLWWRINPIGTLPDDDLSRQIAQRMQTPGPDRDRLTTGIFIPTDANQALGRLEQAFLLSAQTESLLKTIKQANQAIAANSESLITAALASSIIQADEAELLKKSEAARSDAIQVDAFALNEFSALLNGNMIYCGTGTSQNLR
ncbi:MAG: acyl-CoA dehydrogenase [Leptolyngbyaceae cyanobacterium CSU_1_4]|nr:acyl-CoA dehydrogenase [Leptolyngbyaceae cyanobacterium CSU_1_4]